MWFRECPAGHRSNEKICCLFLPAVNILSRPSHSIILSAVDYFLHSNFRMMVSGTFYRSLPELYSLFGTPLQTCHALFTMIPPCGHMIPDNNIGSGTNFFTGFAAVTIFVQPEIFIVIAQIGYGIFCHQFPPQIKGEHPKRMMFPAGFHNCGITLNLFYGIAIQFFTTALFGRCRKCNIIGRHFKMECRIQSNFPSFQCFLQNLWGISFYAAGCAAAVKVHLSVRYSDSGHKPAHHLGQSETIHREKDPNSFHIFRYLNSLDTIQRSYGNNKKCPFGMGILICSILL